jgi:hypothetical protein
MAATLELSEYLDEIRTQVCSRCVERPAGGPPCLPQGKFCGVEMHLEELVKSIHEVRSNFLSPYLNHNRDKICETCAFLHSSFCPCPMDYLLVLLVQAVETVDRRHGSLPDEEMESPAEQAFFSLDDLFRVYQECAGTWTGCDWSTRLGQSGLDLSGCTAARAEALVRETAGTGACEDWKLAAAWLGQIEQYAQKAEHFARQALEAARNGRWREALEHGQHAWALEFASGRTVWRPYDPAWLRLRQFLEKAYLVHKQEEIRT